MKVFVISFGLIIVGAIFAFGAHTSQAAQSSAPGEIRLVESTPQRVVIEITAPTLTRRERVVNGTTYTELNATKWGRTDLPGKPQLPMSGILVAIPQQAKVNVRITQDRTWSETLARPVLPAPRVKTNQPSAEELPEFVGFEYVPDAATYSASSLYPSDIVSTTAPAQWRSQRYVRVQFYPFQYNPVTRELKTHTKLRIEIDFGLNSNAVPELVGQTVNEGSFEAILKQSLINYDSARTWRVPQRRAPNLPTPERAAQENNSYKISVNADGIYEVTCDALIAAGFDANGANLDTLKLFLKDSQVAIEIVEDGDKKCESGEYFLFYGQAPADYAIPFNVYWLTYGGANGNRMALRTATGGTTPESYIKTLHLEQNVAYFTYAPFVEDADHWVWKFVNNPNPYTDVPADLSDLASGAPNGTLRVLEQSGVQNNPYVPLRATIYSNGAQINQQNWFSGSSLLTTSAVNNLVPGTNTFRIEDYVASSGAFVFLNYVELDYTARFVASGDLLRFRYANNGLWQYKISGFTNSNLNAFDISDPNNVARLNVSASASNGAFMGSFSDDVSAQREYIVLADSQFKIPASIALDTPSSLRSTANGADYVIITYGAWKNNVQPLAVQRAPMGRVMVIDVEDIYDEFNYGLKSAQAIRNFLEYAYANWQLPKLSYVLLMGDGNMDNGNNEFVYIPVYMKLVDPWIGMVAADNRLVTLDVGSELPSIAIGRFTARSATDVDNIVKKLLDYENNTGTGAWRTKVAFVSDNAYASNGVLDSAGNFFDYSEEVAGDSYLMPSPMVADRIYYNPCTNTTSYPWCAFPYSTYSSSANARTAVLDLFSEGRLIINYVGHGAVLYWAENLLKTADVPNLAPGNGSPKYPFMMPMTCYDGYFQSGWSNSISEALVRQKDGGAIGSFAPAGLGVAVGHDYLNRGFFEALMQGGKPRAGQAAIAAKVKLFTEGGGGSGDLIDTYNLLGDPGLLFQLPDGIRPTPTNSPTQTFTPSNTPTPSATPTFTNTPTNTPTFTLTNTPTNTLTPSLTPTDTPTPTSTHPDDPTWTPTHTPTDTPTPSNTPTFTNTPTDTPTPTATFTALATDTPTLTPTLDVCSVKPAGPDLMAPADKFTTPKQRVKLEWNAGVCVTKYKVVVKQGSKSGPVADAKVIKNGKTTYQTIELPRNSDYVWRVRACNAAGCAWSPWRTFRIK